MQGISSGKLAKLAGVNIETIRYYEREGLIPEPLRKNGRKLYFAADIERMRFIRQVQSLGFSLAEIRDFLALLDSGQSSWEDVQSLAEQKIVQVEQKISDLEEIRRILYNIKLRQEPIFSVERCPLVRKLKKFRKVSED
ncbi:MAG: MerR family transcriptional regulator [Firmicutes bacterium]|nr:MerR family transcriptional regulator [Bacillota bacterium]